MGLGEAAKSKRPGRGQGAKVDGARRSGYVSAPITASMRFFIVIASKGLMM